ncbi:MAG: YfhO family protein [Anaerolineae bacterium]|nr:YfhO family protein [Anaerolineae bacterium]
MAHPSTDSPTVQTADLPRGLPLVLLVAALLALFHRLALGDALYWGLPALQFGPWRAFASAEIAAGRLPLWNPYNGAGAPFLANYQSAVLYPPHLVLLLVKNPAPLVGLLGVVHILWAGLGMELYTRRLGLPALGRGIAVLAFPLSTTLIARLGTPPMIDVAAWLPWLLLALDALIARPGVLRMLGAALVTAMLLLAGHAQWAAYGLGLGGAYAAWRVWAARWPVRRLAPVLVAVALGVGLAGVQLAPTLELQRLSQRAGGVDEAFALNFSFPVPSLVTFFNPDFFGNPGDGTYAIGGAYFETAAYVGVITALIALPTLSGRFRRRARQSRTAHDGLIGFFGAVGGLSLLLAFGSYTPIFPFLYRHVPGFNLFQAPARFLLATAFALVMIAALGAPALLRAPHTPAARRARRLGLAAALGLALTGLMGGALVRDQAPLLGQLAQGLATLGALVAAGLWLLGQRPRPGHPRQRLWSAAVLILLALDLTWANGRSNPTTGADFFAPLPDALPDSSPATRTYTPQDEFERLVYDEFLPFSDYRLPPDRLDTFRRSGLANVNLLDGQSSLNNFDPLRPDGFERLTRLLDSSPRRDVLALAAAVGLERDAPRVWLVGEAVAAPDLDAAVEAMAAPSFDPRRTVMLETASAPPVAPFSGGTARIVADEPQWVQIAVDSPGGGYLVLADTFYPGWEATLDGAPVPIARANLNFRALALPSGSHQVDMRYRPASFTAGLALTGFSLMVTGILTALTLFRQRRRRET